MTKEIAIVELLESPTRENGYFYKVKDANGIHYYVSGLGGKAAQGMPVGSQFKLVTHSPSKSMNIYMLQKTP